MTEATGQIPIDPGKAQAVNIRQDTDDFFLELNALTAGVTIDEARRVTREELNLLADSNPLLLGA